MQCSSWRSARPRLRSNSQTGSNVVLRPAGAVTPRIASARRRSPGCKQATSAARKDLEPISLDNQKRIAIIGSVDDVLSSTDEANLKQLSTTEAAGALPPPGTSTATKGAGTGLAEALNLAPKPPSSSAAAAAAAADDLPTDDATDPELASWVEQLQQESMALATQLSQYRSQAASKIASLAARPTLEPAARQELEELTAVLQAALAQVDVLSRQAALAEVLQHRIADQEDVLQQLQNELEHVDAQRAAEYETTLANINELEEALALAQDQVDASHRLEELLEVKEALQKQLEGAQADLEAAAGQLAESRKKGEALAAQLATAEEAKGLAEKAKAAAEEARKEAEVRLATLKDEYEQLQAEVKKAQEAAEQLAAAAQQQKAAAAATTQQQKDPRGKKAKRQKGAKGFGKVDAAGKGATELATGETGDSEDLDEMTGDESDGEGSSVLDLSGMVALMKAKEEEVAASKVKLDEAAGKLKEAEDKLKASEEQVTKLKADLEKQKAELEAAATAKLEEAEAAFTKQLAEMQTLLADYQTQVIELSKQNTDLEEEALALEQKLGEAEASVEKGEKRLAELSAQLASGANGSKEMREKVKEKEEELEASKAELQEMKDELKSAVKREASKALELSRAQQDLLLAEKASTKLQAERDDLAKKVVALRSSQLKAEQAIADAAAAETKLEEAGQQLAAVRAQLTTETARAQQLAAQMGAAKEAEKEALAKLSAAQVALQDASKLAASRGSQVEALSAQLDALKASVANMSSQGQQAGAGTAAQLAQRDATIKETRQQLESAQADNSRLVGQLTSLKQQLDQAAAAGPSTSSKQVQEVQAQAAQLFDKVTQLQSQLAHKDADIASLADKLEAAVEAAANATRAAAAQQQQPGSAAARGVADEEARKAVALAQTQVEEAVRARLSLEKEASLLRASNDNYSQQVDALTAQVSKLEVIIAEATEQNNLATTQLQQVKSLAMAETEAAAAILGKAERLIKSLAEQRQQQRQREAAAAAAAAAGNSQTETALRAQVADLQVKLAEQADIAVEASARAEQLEEDLAGLRAEVAQMRRTSSITGGGSSPAYAQMSAEVQEREAALTGQLASLEARAAAAAAERDAIRSRVLQLETELRQKDAALEETMAAAAASGGRDKQVATLMAKVSSLEAQNSQLRVAAAKREQVLQQSRKFIEGHLAKWAPGSPGSGAAAAAAGAATATSTAANGLNNGSGGMRQ